MVRRNLYPKKGYGQLHLINNPKRILTQEELEKEIDELKKLLKEEPKQNYYKYES